MKITVDRSQQSIRFENDSSNAFFILFLCIALGLPVFFFGVMASSGIDLSFLGDTSLGLMLGILYLFLCLISIGACIFFNKAACFHFSEGHISIKTNTPIFRRFSRGKSYSFSELAACRFTVTYLTGRTGGGYQLLMLLLSKSGKSIPLLTLDGKRSPKDAFTIEIGDYDKLLGELYKRFPQEITTLRYHFPSRDR